MPKLVPNKTVKTAKPELVVTNQLKAGKYRLRLVVVDDSGKLSKPAELEITVKAARRRNPTDVIRDRVVVDPVVRDSVVTDALRRRVTPAPSPQPPPSPPSRARVRRRATPTPAPKPPPPSPPASRRRRVRPTPVTPRRPRRR